MSVLSTLRRRWLTGLVVFGLVTVLVGLLAQRAPDKPVVDDPTPTATVESYNVTWRMVPQGATSTEQYPAMAMGSTLTGTWLAVLNGDALRSDVLKEAGVDVEQAKVASTLVASQPPLVLGVRLETKGLKEADARRVLQVWDRRGREALADVVPKAGGQPIVTFEKLSDFGPTPVEKPATTVQTPKKAVKTIGWPLALLLGLISGLVAMFVHDALDRRVTSARQLAEVAGGAPQLPTLALPATGTAATGAVLDSVRLLRASVLGGDSDVTLLVSPDDAGHSDVVATELARSLAAAGRDTLLVLRDATAASSTGAAVATAASATTGASASSSTSATRTGGATAATGAAQRAGHLTTVHLPGGGDVEDSVAGPQVHTFLSEAASQHDQVVIAGGSLRRGSAAATLAAMTGQTVLVVGSGTPQRAVSDSLRRLREVRAHVLGVTVNRG